MSKQAPCSAWAGTITSWTANMECCGESYYDDIFPQVRGGEYYRNMRRVKKAEPSTSRGQGEAVGTSNLTATE